nr:archaemetzincin-1 isoform X1 [Oryctolagus cuniculus]
MAAAAGALRLAHHADPMAGPRVPGTAAGRRFRESPWPWPRAAHGQRQERPGEARPCVPAMLQCRPAQEFSFGPRALKDALLSGDAALRQLYAASFSPAERLFLSEAYNPRRSLFCSLLVHSAFDWLLSRPEAPEDFAAFHASLGRRRPSPARKHIYLQPIDLIEGPVGGPLLDTLRSCTEAFFLGLQVKCLPSVAAASIHCSSRPARDSESLQLHTDGILAFLEDIKPEDALCVLGLTLADLYPNDAWAFTFGKFRPGREVAVCSFARFSGGFLQVGPSAPELALAKAAASRPGSPLQEGGPAPCIGALGLAQCCKVACHELCHLLGLGNCRWLRCLMQGALRLDEALRRPLDLCPICLRKLQHVLGFKLLDRYKRLHAWTQAVLESWPGHEAGERSLTEDTPPLSADSGVCWESDSEPLSSPSEPPTPDTLSRPFPAGLELDPKARLGSLEASEAVPQPRGPGEAMEAHGRWLAACIQALERDVAEEELALLDQAVDALERWELFTGQLPAPRQDVPSARDGTGLRRALGDKFSSLRRRLSARRLSKAESPPCDWDGET